MNDVTTARGKFMIAGEYAVLFGGKALVGCSAQHARCTFIPRDELTLAAITGCAPVSLDLLTTVVKTCTERGLTVRAGDYVVDSSAFFDAVSGVKLGLGSSAAVTVALCKMVLMHNGIDDKTVLLSLSLACHQQFSGGLGSGADVAASVYGCPIAFIRAEPLPEITPIVYRELVDNLVIVHTSSAQNTRDYIRRVMSLRESNPDFVADFVAHSNNFVEQVLRAQNEHDFIAALDAFNPLLKSLGEAAGITIITDEHEAIRKKARALGGTAKPSGAGGGDIAIAFVPLSRRESFVVDVAP